MQRKVTVEKTPKRAGGPHFFGLQPPKKIVGLPPCTLVACRFFRGSESDQTFCNAVRSTSREQGKEEAAWHC
jgi:hypothetical protein